MRHSVLQSMATLTPKTHRKIMAFQDATLGLNGERPICPETQGMIENQSSTKAKIDHEPIWTQNRGKNPLYDCTYRYFPLYIYMF